MRACLPFDPWTRAHIGHPQPSHSGPVHCFPKIGVLGFMRKPATGKFRKAGEFQRSVNLWTDRGGFVDEPNFALSQNERTFIRRQFRRDAAMHALWQFSAGAISPLPVGISKPHGSDIHTQYTRCFYGSSRVQRVNLSSLTPATGTRQESFSYRRTPTASHPSISNTAYAALAAHRSNAPSIPASPR